MKEDRTWYRGKNSNMVIMYNEKNNRLPQTRIYGARTDLIQLVYAMYDVVGYPVPPYKARKMVKNRTKKSDKGRDSYIIIEELLADVYCSIDVTHSFIKYWIKRNIRSKNA